MRTHTRWIIDTRVGRWVCVSLSQLSIVILRKDFRLINVSIERAALSGQMAKLRGSRANYGGMWLLTPWPIRGRDYVHWKLRWNRAETSTRNFYETTRAGLPSARLYRRSLLAVWSSLSAYYKPYLNFLCENSKRALTSKSWVKTACCTRSRVARKMQIAAATNAPRL